MCELAMCFFVQNAHFLLVIYVHMCFLLMKCLHVFFVGEMSACGPFCV